jgi:uroporphyrinogen-III synthase
LFKQGKVDAVILTSSSCVESFATVFSRRERAGLARKTVVALIGPVSAATARAEGIPVTVESKVYTIEGVTQALIDHYAGLKS